MMKTHLLQTFCCNSATTMKSIWIFRLRALVSVLGLVALTFNIVGVLCGFVFFELFPQQINSRHLLKVTGQSDSRTTRLRTNTPSGSILIQSQTTLPFTPSPSSSPLFASQTLLSKLKPTPRFPLRQRRSTNNPTRGGLRQPDAPCVYGTGRTPEDGSWYNFSVDNSLRFYAYSAFVDDRPAIGSETVVRIIALSTKLEKDDLGRVGKTLYCVFHYKKTNSENQTPVTVPMNSKAGPIGYGLELDSGVKLKEYIFTCPLGNREPSLPAAVTIVGDPGRLSAVSSCLPIQVPEKPRAKEDFAVCVQVSYGQLNPYRLIEWFELQRILGVSRVGVYDLSIEPGPGLQVLRHYAREGFVELRKTDALPVSGQSQYLIHGSPVINDCLYRNMYSFSWILVIDFDEVIVPKIHSNLRDLAAHLDKTSSRSPTVGPVNFLILNQYFFFDSDPDTSESANYTVLRYRRKVALSPQGYATKGYVDPLGCVQMHNHYCMGVAKAFEARNHYEFVDPTVATSHHYKRCHLSLSECQKMLAQTTQDDVMLTYKATLKKNVERILKDVFR